MSERVPSAADRRPAEEAFWNSHLHLPPDQAVPQVKAPWWVAHTRPRGEKALGRDLQRLGIPFYLPLRRNITHSRNTGRSSSALVPAFTGYLFFAADPNQRQLALQTNRIASLLDVSDPLQLITELRAVHAVLSSETAFTLGTPLKRGDWVEVLEGPLTGVQGRIQQTRGRTRLVLSVEMLGQAVVVELPREALQKTDPPAT